MPLRALIIATLLLPVASARRKVGERSAGLEVREGSDAGYCCCKRGVCTSPESDAVLRRYWPDEGLCCKRRSSACNAPFAFTGYTMPRDGEWCEESPLPGGTTGPQWQLPAPAAVDAGGLKNGSAAHTLHTHCATGSGAGADGVDTRSAIIGQLTQELVKNNVQSMVEEIFTLYTCIRWVPDSSYTKLGKDEIDSGRLLARDSAGGSAELNTARAVERGSFIPLRCSQNIGIYDATTRTDAGQEHYPEFERRMRAMASFFGAEHKRALDARMRLAMKTSPRDPLSGRQEKQKRWARILKDAELFSLELVEGKAAACEAEGRPAARINVDVHSAEAADLLRDCGFVAWWTPKLRDWNAGFPFQAYLAGAGRSSLNPGQRVLICFGKRVSGELHRHRAGSHILMDMNGVGCHGFWDFKETAKMLTRMVDLWAPPTCQLTMLELKMKTRLLEMFSTMNKNLFEALPSMVASESFSDDDPSPKESKGIGKISAGFSHVVKWMTSTRDTYKQLGNIMSSSVMKWSVCPVGEEQGLDGKLGSDDLLTQKFTKKAYQQWTGKKAALPGKTCKPLGARDWATASGLETCELGVVRENYPEPYKEIGFACPALPLLPAGQQLRILSEAHPDKCLAMATPDQVLAQGWPYKGLRPAEVQYQPRDHAPTSQVELVQVLDVRSGLDRYGTSRDYVTLARSCTVEVWEKYPRWCDPPALMNDAVPLGERLVRGVSDGVDNAINAAEGIANVGRHNDRQGWTTWLQRQAISMGNGLAQFYRDSRKLVTKMGGASVARLERIRTQRVYNSVEAGEALWGASFQQQQPGGGSRKQFGRYAITFPCKGTDVLKQIESEYAWGQVALQLLFKVTGKSPHIVQEPLLTMAVRSEVLILDGPHFSKAQQIAIRAGSYDAEFQWYTTKRVLPFVEDALKMSAGEAISSSMPETYGVELQLKCGHRDEIYKDQSSPEAFISCVKSGVEQANQRAAAHGREASAIKKLRDELESAQEELDAIMVKIENADEDGRDAFQATADEKSSAVREKEAALNAVLRSKPLTLGEYNREIVVRVDFAPSSKGECLFYKDSAMDKWQGQPEEETPQGAGPEAGKGSSRTEKNRRMVDAMLKKAHACGRTRAETKYHGQAPGGKHVLGAYKGGGVPPHTQKEVILSPLDVLPWIREEQARRA